MLQGHAFVDWDDTLASNLPLFFAAEARLSERIAAALDLAPAAVSRRFGLEGMLWRRAWAGAARRKLGAEGRPWTWIPPPWLWPGLSPWLRRCWGCCCCL